MRYSTALSALFCLFCIPACSGSSNNSALVNACVETSNLDKSICDCVAKKASEELSENAYAFLVASLTQDTAIATELRGEMDMTEVMQAGMFMTHAPAKCAAEQSN